MLNAFRSRGLSSVIYGVIIVATILVFVIQFNPSAGKKTASLGEQCAARVRGWCITPKDHQAAFRVIIPRGPQGELQTKKARQMGLFKVALDGLVERELLLHEAERLGLSVSEEEITDEIYNGFIHVSVPSDNPGLGMSLNVMDGKVYAGFRDQKTKRFDMKVYERSIKAIVNRSPTEFREEQARELIAAKMRDVIRAPVRVSEVEGLESYIDEKSTASLTYVQIRQSWVAKYAVPTPAGDVDAWAKEPANTGIVDAALKERSGEHIRHILAKFGGSGAQTPSASDKQAAKERIEQALARIKAGESFSNVAKEMSDDGSAAQGGDVGIKTDGFVPPFREAADKLKPGQMTPEPVETEFGYHLIMKDAPQTEAQFTAMRKELERDLYAKTKAPDLAKAIADRIITQAKAGKSLEDAVKEITGPIAASYAAAHPAPAAPRPAPARRSADGGAADATVEGGAPAKPVTDTPDTDPMRPQVTTTSAFNKGGDPIVAISTDAAAQIMKFAFGTAKDGDVLGEALKADDGYAVATLKQHKLATKEEFDKDKDTYLLTLVARKQAEALSLYVKRLKEQSKSEIKIDDKYLAERAGNRDGGTSPVDEDEEGF